jgi:hypothetical protein
MLVLMALSVAMPPATAASADLDAIERECHKQFKMPPGGCQCMRERAAKMEDDQQKFVLAILLKDEAAQARLRDKLEPKKLVDASLFFTRVPSQCIRGR